MNQLNMSLVIFVIIYWFSSCFLSMCLAIVGIVHFCNLTVLTGVMKTFLFPSVSFYVFFLVFFKHSFGSWVLTHFSENLWLNLSLLACKVSRFNCFSFTFYGSLLFVMRLTATFCTLSNSLLFFWVIAEPQTTLDCSMTLLIYAF